MFRNTNRLLYTSRVIGVNGIKQRLNGIKSLNQSSPILQQNINRQYSLFWQRMGIDFARAKIRLNPLSRLEAGGRYFFWVAFEWVFVGMFIMRFCDYSKRKKATKYYI